jgi:hypothetical protein
MSSGINVYIFKCAASVHCYEHQEQSGIPPERQNEVFVIKSEEMKMYKLSDQIFKIIVLRKLSELQGNTE